MNAKQIKNMNIDECLKEIIRLDVKAEVEHRKATKSELALIEKLSARIYDLDPDRE